MSFNTRFSREYAGGSIGGILRKGGSVPANNVTAAADSLLVFGYSAKLFRDDDKARDIDQGKHLINWMNDGSLKIDRYDVRANLFDLAPYEAPPGGYGNRLDYLSAEEQRAEQLCEEERYLYLYFNEDEHILQQEEDLKRLQQESGGSAYGQVAFQYGNDSGGIQHGPNRDEFSNSPTGDEPDVTFALPANFEVPPSIQLPDTMKQHAIIEKTARFIASQGTQMEILLKAKQSNNVQFEFLNQNSLLNPYYKHVVHTIKDGKYPENTEAPTTETTVSSNVLDTPSQDPSPVKTVITVPTIKYKPSADCAYTQLISKIKGVPLPSVMENENSSSPVVGSPLGTTTESIDNFNPFPLKHNNVTYAQSTEDNTKNCEENTNSNSGVAQVEILKNSSALALAQNYSSDSEEDDTEAIDGDKEQDVVAPPKPIVQLNFPIPQESLQNIIDKTATYVIKNGRQFEETLRTKSEERFTFLLPTNEYYPYYMYKITGDPDAASKEEKTRKAAAVAAALLSKKGLLQDKTVSPVSFSIKSKDDTPAANLTPALPQELSDEDDENTQKKSEKTAVTRSVPEHVQKAIKMVESQLMARNAQLAAVVLPPMVASINASVGLTAKKSSCSRFDIEHPIRNPSTALSRSEKIEMERNALFEQQQQNRQKEMKKAEERVKDKLAQIAKEKLGGLLSKEKQLQLERKRKAMVFLNQIKGDSNTVANADTTTPKSILGESETLNADSDASNASVHSIPITSYGPDDEEEPMKDLPYIPNSNTLPQSTKTPLTVKTATVTVSDDEDDDVQLINDTKEMTKLQSNDKSTRDFSQNRKVYRKRGRSKGKESKDSGSSSSSPTSASSEDDDPEEKRQVREKRSKRSREKRKDKPLKTEKRHRSSKSKSKKTRTRSPSRKESSHSYAVTKERHKSLRSCSRSPLRFSQISSRKTDRRHRSRSDSRDSSKSRDRSRMKKDKKRKSKSRHD